MIWPTNHLNTVGARHIDARERRRYAKGVQTEEQHVQTMWMRDESAIET